MVKFIFKRFILPILLLYYSSFSAFKKFEKKFGNVKIEYEKIMKFLKYFLKKIDVIQNHDKKGKK